MADYNSAAAKTHVMYGKRLTRENYTELASLKNVQSVAEYLIENTYYAGAFSGVSEYGIHRGQVENLVREFAFNEWLRLYGYVRDDELSAFPIREKEISELLRFIVLLGSGKPGEFLLRMNDYFKQHCSYDLYALAACKTYDDMLEVIENTDYYNVLERLKPSANGDIDTGRIENALMDGYYESCERLVKKSVAKSDREDVLKCLGMKADLKKIYTVIRLRTYFTMSGDQIEKYLFKYSYRLKPATLTKLMNCPVAEIGDVLKKSCYGQFFSDADGEYPENASEEYLRSTFRYIYRFGGSVAQFTAYTALRQIEIENIVRIIEGIRYGISPNEIVTMLVGEEA